MDMTKRLMMITGMVFVVALSIDVYGMDAEDEECKEAARDVDVRGGALSALCNVIQQGDVEAVRLLLASAHDIDINGKDGEDGTPLLYAVKDGRGEMVKMLLECEANVNACNESGESPLVVASFYGHEDLVALLLDRKAQIDVKDEEGNTSFSHASRNGHVSVLKKLLNHALLVGSDVIKEKDECLFQAAQANRIDAVRLLLDEKANVDVMDSDGVTALCRASGCGSASMVTLLLERRADTEKTCCAGLTPLIVASCRGRLDIVDMLLDRKANIEAVDDEQKTPLLAAGGDGHSGVVKRLLEEKANTDVTYKEGESLLYRASYAGNLDIVKLVVANKGDVNKVNSEDQTPLIAACDQGHVEVTRILLDNGANTCANPLTGSALLRAAVQGNLDIVCLLLNRKCPIDIAENKYGYTPLLAAARVNRGEIAKALLAAGAQANLDFIDKEGEALLSFIKPETYVLFLEEKRVRELVGAQDWLPEELVDSHVLIPFLEVDVLEELVNTYATHYGQEAWLNKVVKNCIYNNRLKS